MAKRGIRFEHSVGELVLCFEPDPTKARVLYEAKVLDSQVSRDKTGRKCAAYLVHFQGWNNSWDRLVPESFILKASEENKALMKRLTETAKKHRKNRQRRRKIDQILRDANVKAPAQDSSESDSDSSGSDEDMQSENEDPNKNCPQNGSRNRIRRKQQPKQECPPVTIDIPDILKSRLEEDYIAVSIRGKLCSLPAKPCVVDILEGFMKTFCVNYLCEPAEREPLGKERDKVRSDKHVLKLPPDHVFAMCKELVDGLRILFDFTLPIILLYATEQEQYESAMKAAQSEHTPATQDMDKQPATEHKQKRGRPVAHKGGRGHHEAMEETSAESEVVPKRLTRRSTIDSHLSDDQPSSAAHPSARRPKKDNTPNVKLSPRALRRRGIHDDPLSIKVEDTTNSDPEVEFSPLASTSATTTTTSGDPTPGASACGGAGPGVPGASGPESLGSGGLQHRRKEDLTDSILTWQVLPAEVRKQMSVMPSQVYGIHHLLRLFVKLPELLNRMNFENHKLQVLVKLCHNCLQYLVDHQQEFYN
ncbi:MSL complex subunit 3-like isoform X2 [Babylonia areolata]|uniref:MSL complex subunit 3-like isoform X2 n=1 Tax=Babylonia areolata TaxID=304850 RepID=UPI003FD53B52